MPLLTVDGLQYWSVSQELEESQVVPQIQIAERTYILKALGVTLYNKIVTDHEADTLTGDYKTLYNTYIVPALALYTLYEMMPIVKSEVTAQGLITNAPEFTEPASNSDYGKMSNKLIMNAETYISDMITFLCEANLPEYKSPQDISSANSILLY